MIENNRPIILSATQKSVQRLCTNFCTGYITKLLPPLTKRTSKYILSLNIDATAGVPAKNKKKLVFQILAWWYLARLFCMSHSVVGCPSMRKAECISQVPLQSVIQSARRHREVNGPTRIKPAAKVNIFVNWAAALRNTIISAAPDTQMMINGTWIFQ